jgi:hypothetical protein
MGRPSKLVDSQWREIHTRLANGEKAAELGREFGVSKQSISNRFHGRTETVKAVANQLVAAEVNLRALPVNEQIAALNLAEELRNISSHLAGAARFGAATAHRLAGIAHEKSAEIEGGAPLDERSIEAVRGIAALTRTANEAASLGMGLLNANKDSTRRAEAASIPDSLGYFYGEQDPS